MKSKAEDLLRSILFPDVTPDLGWTYRFSPPLLETVTGLALLGAAELLREEDNHEAAEGLLWCLENDHAPARQGAANYPAWGLNGTREPDANHIRMWLNAVVTELTGTASPPLAGPINTTHNIRFAFFHSVTDCLA